MTQARVLIIDDEIEVCTFFRRLLTSSGYQVATATDQPEAERALEMNTFDVALVDLKLPDTDGLTLLKLIKACQPACEVILMTGYSTVRTAVQAVQLGAYEYLEKPFDDIDEIEALIAKAVSYGKQRMQVSAATEEWDEVARAVGFQVGNNAAMRRLVSLAYKIAQKNIAVLIQGKTGSGKEVLARFIHAASGRADQPFLPVNCGALPENLLESELFGQEKGAFTGASQTRRGIFELAHRGTLFLDEIGDASPLIQVKLLRVLETGEFTRVGGEKPIRTDVRLIAATNVDLEEAIREKTFREDLFYRINVVRLEIPPLQARSEDIASLAEHFVHQFNPELKLSTATRRLLENYPWPGNIRELANIMRRAAVLCPGETIEPEHLGGTLLSTKDTEDQAVSPSQPKADQISSPEDFRDYYSQPENLERMTPSELNLMLHALQGLESAVLSVLRGKGAGTPVTTDLRATEEDMIRRSLEQHRWNITETARALGIARNTLHRKIKKLNLRNT